MIFAGTCSARYGDIANRAAEYSDDLNVLLIARHPYPPVPGTVTTLADADGLVHRRYDVSDGRVFLLDKSLRIAWQSELDGFIAMKRTDLASIIAEHHSATDLSQAPVLSVANVLAPELCDRLMHQWETGGAEETGVLRLDQRGASYAFDSHVKRRRDHFLREPRLVEELTEVLRRRLLPQLEHAFHFEADRFEMFRIACYDSSDEGHFQAHRDNRTPKSRARKYTLSINLNSGDFSGGEIWFPEYSRRLYRPPTGSALVFSSALLHEVRPVTSSRRFCLVTFAY